MLVNICKNFIEKDVMVEFTYCLKDSDFILNNLDFPTSETKLLGKWIGSEAPKIGIWYDVEIAIGNKVDWEEDIRIIEGGVEGYITYDEKGTIKISGYLQITDLDFVTLQIGQSLISLTVFGAPASYSGFVEIATSSILLYDTNTLKFMPIDH